MEAQIPACREAGTNTPDADTQIDLSGRVPYSNKKKPAEKNRQQVGHFLLKYLQRILLSRGDSLFTNWQL